MATNNELTPLQMTQQVLQIVRESRSSSLPEYTSPTRLRPVAMMDQAVFSALEEKDMQNILQTKLSIYSAHYLQAVALQNATIHGVNTLQILDQFSTDRNIAAGGILTGYADKQKALGFGLESLRLDTHQPTAGLEAMDDSKAINSPVNLAVGRLLNVKIGVGDQSTTIPVSVAFAPRVISSEALPKLMANIDVDTSWSGRYHQLMAGEIESVADFLFGLDLIRANKKALLNDETGLYRELSSKKSRSIVATVLSGRASLNKASAMACITKNTAEELELQLKGKLKNPRVRERYFEESNSMMITVVDPLRERLTIHQRGIADSGMYTFKDIQQYGSKQDAADIGGILEAYKLGRAPTL